MKTVGILAASVLAALAICSCSSSESSCSIEEFQSSCISADEMEVCVSTGEIVHNRCPQGYICTEESDSDNSSNTHGAQCVSSK